MAPSPGCFAREVSFQWPNMTEAHSATHRARLHPCTAAWSAPTEGFSGFGAWGVTPRLAAL